MLIKAATSALIVVDVQSRLSIAMSHRDQVLANGAKLMTGASQLDVPILVSEQYPKGIGHTDFELAALAPEGSVVEKIHFSCMAEPDFAQRLKALGRGQAVVMGIEAHVCVLQTALQLAELGIHTFVVADATSSRDPANHALAMGRMQKGGVDVVSTEMVLFEWMERAGTDAFKSISKLIK